MLVELSDYGDVEISKLALHYSMFVNRDECVIEWDT